MWALASQSWKKTFSTSASPLEVLLLPSSPVENMLYAFGWYLGTVLEGFSFEGNAPLGVGEASPAE